MDQNMNRNTDPNMGNYGGSLDIESVISEKRKMCKVLKVLKIVSFIGIFASFVAFMVASRNGYELDSVWLLIPALFVGGFFLFLYMETNKRKDLKELMGQYVVRSILGERVQVLEYMPNGYTNEAFLHNCPILLYWSSFFVTLCSINI